MSYAVGNHSSSLHIVNHHNACQMHILIVYFVGGVHAQQLRETGHVLMHYNSLKIDKIHFPVVIEAYINNEARVFLSDVSTCTFFLSWVTWVLRFWIS